MVAAPFPANPFMVTGDIPQIWLQLQDEPAEAYADFCYFLEMGPARTVRDAYRQSKGKPDAREASRVWRENSTRFEWFKRADARDRHQAALDRQAEEREFARERAQWAKRRVGIRSDAWEDAQALRARAREILKLPLVEEVKTTREEKSEDGATTIIHTTIINKPVRASMSDAAGMMKDADKLARLAADMETERVVHERLEEQRARQLEDARQAFKESAALYPNEPPLARAQALSVAYGFSVEAIMQETPTIDGTTLLS